MSKKDCDKAQFLCS